MPKKKRTIRQWIRLLDREMGALVRSKKFCDHCGGEYERMEWCHVIGRSNKTLRWDILNALTMDARCHKWWWHENPLESAKWFREKYPGRYEYLMKAKNVVLRRTDEDYQKILDAIRNKEIDKLHLPLDYISKL